MTTTRSLSEILDSPTRKTATIPRSENSSLRSLGIETDFVLDMPAEDPAAEDPSGESLLAPRSLQSIRRLAPNYHSLNGSAYNSLTRYTIPQSKEDRIAQSCLVRWGIPIFASTMETLQVFMGIMDLDTLFKFIPLDNKATKLIASTSTSGIYFGITLVTNHIFIINGITTLKHLLNLQIPDDHERWLSQKQFTLSENIASMTIAGVTGVVASFNDSVSTIYFLGKMGLSGNLVYLGGTIGVIAGVATLCSESVETFRCTRFMVARVPMRVYPKNILLKVPTIVVGYTLSLFGAAEDIIDTYGAVAAMIAKDSVGKNVILGLAVFNGFSNLFYEGQWTVDALNEFAVNLSKGKECLPNLREGFSFALALSVSALMAYAQQALASDMLKDPETELPFSFINENIILTLATGIFFRDWISNTYFAYDLFKIAVNKFADRLSEKCFGRASDRKPEPNATYPTSSLLSNSLYKPKKTSSLTQPAPLQHDEEQNRYLNLDPERKLDSVRTRAPGSICSRCVIL